MARCKNTKRLYNPKSIETKIVENPTQFYAEKPSWKFHLRDRDNWQLSKEHAGDEFWDRILEHLHSWEQQSWNEILVSANKQNHPIDVNGLNKIARERLQQLHIEVESIIALRLSGTHRLYGIMEGSSFCIIWFDKNHGDNDTCVCRSYKKFT